MCESIAETTEKLDSVRASSNGFMSPCTLPLEDAAVVGTCEASEGFKTDTCCSWRLRPSGPAASSQGGGIMASMPSGRRYGDEATAAVVCRERSFGTVRPSRGLATSFFHHRSSIDRANECCGRGRDGCACGHNLRRHS